MSQEQSDSVKPQTFYRCHDLQTVELPDNFTSIDEEAFYECSSLNKIDLPDRIQDIKDNAFKNCFSLKDVNTNYHIENIGTSAFCNCSSLTSFSRFADEDRNHTFNMVGDYALYGTNLTSLNLALRSSSIYTFWGDYAFANMSSLTEVNILSSCYMSTGMFANDKNLKKVNFKHNMTSYVYPFAFQNCTALASISIPDKVWYISEGMFKNCTSLSSISYIDSGNPMMNLVQKNSINGCSKLEKIYLPASINKLDMIDPEAFTNAKNLKEIHLDGIPESTISAVDYFPSFGDLYANCFGYLEEEEVYGYFKSEADVEKAQKTKELSIDINQYLPSEYADSRKTIAENARQLKNIIQFADQNNVPVILVCSLRHSDIYAEESCPDCGVGLREIICDFNYTWPDMEILVRKECAYHDMTLKMKYSSKSFEYCYLDDEMSDLTQSDQNLLSGAIIINYVMSIGAVKIKDEDPENPRTAKANVDLAQTAATSKFTAYTGYFDKKFESTLEVISKYFFGSTSGINSSLLSFSNYGLVAARWMKPGKTTASTGHTSSVKFPSDIGDFDVDAGVKFDEAVDWVDAYFEKHPESEEEPPYIQAYICSEYQNFFVGGVIRKLMESTTFKEPYLSCMPGGDPYDGSEPLNGRIVQESLVQNGTLLSSGCFGLKHDVDLYASNGEKIEFIYDSDRYEPPVRHDYESDKTTVDNFEVGKWYYNAKELKDYADKTHLPAMFIYSLLGCNPCQKYQESTWKDPEFQEWAKKQKFLLCGMEVTKQPYYDRQLKFCTDELAPGASNFQKAGENKATLENAFGDLEYANPFRQFVDDNGNLNSNLMTPVIVMYWNKGDGSSPIWFDYTFHNISQIMRRTAITIGSSQKGPGQMLKSLCLYHFDNNSLENPTYVIDAERAFDRMDYVGNSENPYLVRDGIITLNIWSAIESNPTPEAAHQAMRNVLSQHDTESHNYPDYIGGCLWVDYQEPEQLEWIALTYDTGILESDDTTAEQKNAELSKWKIIIGKKMYKLTLNASDYKYLDDGCSMEKTKMYRYSFVETT